MPITTKIKKIDKKLTLTIFFQGTPLFPQFVKN